MAGKPTTKATIKRNAISDMKSLGVFKPQYDRIVDIYSELCEQYIILTKEFESGGYKYQAGTTQGGEKKAPIVATLESLRKDILAYSDRLCLNPKSIETVTTEKATKSKLVSILSELK